jgi:hypothetical protein
MRAHVILFPLLLTIFVLPQLLQALDDFSRQPAGQVILTRHDRSDSEPQQVSLRALIFNLLI